MNFICTGNKYKKKFYKIFDEIYKQFSNNGHNVYLDEFTSTDFLVFKFLCLYNWALLLKSSSKLSEKERIVCNFSLFKGLAFMSTSSISELKLSSLIILLHVSHVFR